MAFIYVCLEVIDFSLVFAYWDFVEPIRYRVCFMDVGCRARFIFKHFQTQKKYTSIDMHNLKIDV